MAEINAVYVLIARDLKKFVREKSRLLSTLARPVIWLFLVGGGMSRLVSDSMGMPYIQFIFPGILGMTILFGSIFSSISIIWDKEFGLMKEILVAPVSRFSIVIGKALSGSLISLLQATMILLISPIIGIDLGLQQIIYALAVSFLLAFCISSLGIIIATFFESFESFSAIMNFIVMPMFFLSGAMYPVQKLPDILKGVSKVNPLTYGVDALKHALLQDSRFTDFSIAMDIGVLIAASIIFVSIAGYLFTKRI
ncbi:MAG: ABC transporter permease [Nitrospira sp.]|nr:ABC transporter permease [Nitrospira sp.]